MMEFPCMGCEERHAGCHGKCERYQESKRKHDSRIDQYNWDRRGKMEAFYVYLRALERDRKKKRTQSHGKWKGGE